MITFQGQRYEPQAGETVLECLTRSGVSVPSFCRSGACQTCLMKSTGGSVPKRAQAGLKETWIKQGFLLTCVCPAETELEVEFCEVAQRYSSRIVEVRYLSSKVSLVRLEKPSGLQYQAGQFLQVIRPEDETARPYSIASLPEDDTIDLHVAILPEGKLSPWLASSPGRTVDLRGPFGECFYLPGETERALIFAGTGTGLAPLIGVLRTAFAHGHRGAMTLYHGAREERDLYFTTELLELATRSGCRITEVSLDSGEPSSETGSETVSSVTRLNGDLVDVVLQEQRNPSDARIYLCGAPDLVHKLKKKLYLKGASLDRIHADPFFSKGIVALKGPGASRIQ